MSGDVTATRRAAAAAAQERLFDAADGRSGLSAADAAVWAAAVDAAQTDEQAAQLARRAARDRLRVAGHDIAPLTDAALDGGALLGPAVMAAMTDDGLHAVERLVVAMVAVLLDGEPDAVTDVGVTGVARLLGRRSSSGISRQMARLEELGWIRRIRRRSRGGVIERRALIGAGPRWTAAAEVPGDGDAATVPCRDGIAADCYRRAAARYGVCSRCAALRAAQHSAAAPAPPPPLAPVPHTAVDPPDDVVVAADDRIAALRQAQRALGR